ncbi:hypothetical protein RQP46_010239 [Phenoliferia psychrophenolica]
MPHQRRLVDVPGFGRAWSKLPFNASARAQQLANEADLALIFSSSRTDSLPIFRDADAAAYAEYATPFMRDADATRVKVSCMNQRSLAGIVFNRDARLYDALASGVSRTETDGTYEDAWRRLSVSEREEMLLGGIESYLVGRKDHACRLYAPEITLSGMAGGDGDGLLDLLMHFTPDRRDQDGGDFQGLIPEMYEVLEHDQWDKHFGFGVDEVERMPRPSAIRLCMASERQDRHEFLLQILLYITAQLDGKEPVFTGVADISYAEDKAKGYTHPTLLRCGPCKKMHRDVRYCNPLAMPLWSLSGIVEILSLREEVAEVQARVAGLLQQVSVLKAKGPIESNDQPPKTPLHQTCPTYHSTSLQTRDPPIHILDFAPEITDKIFQLVVKGIANPEIIRQLKDLSLIRRDWNVVARRHILRSVVVSSAQVANELAEQSEQTRSLVRELAIDCHIGAPILRWQRFTPGDVLQYRDVIRLFTALLNLDQLTILTPNFSVINLEDIYRLRDYRSLSNLSSLTLISFPPDLQLAHYLVLFTPNLKSLWIETPPSHPPPYPLARGATKDHFRDLPSLRSLTLVGNVAKGSAFKDLGVVSAATLQNLECIHISHYGGTGTNTLCSILSLLAVRQNLKRLNLEAYVQDQDRIPGLFNQLTRLEELTVGTSSSRYQLALCPPTVHTIVIYGLVGDIRTIENSRQASWKKIVVMRANPEMFGRHPVDVKLEVFCEAEGIELIVRGY